MNYQNDPIAIKLYAFLVCWIQEHPAWPYEAHGWATSLRDAKSVGASLMEDAEFGEVNLAGWFASPDGEMIQTVVGWVLPWPESGEFRLLVEAITLAAKAKQKNERGVAAALTLIGVVLAAMVLFSE